MGEEYFRGFLDGINLVDLRNRKEVNVVIVKMRLEYKSNMENLERI